MQDTYMRGQIYYVASDPSSVPIGAEIWSDRPGLIVSNDTTNKTSGAVEIVYLTTSLHRRPSPLLVKVTSGNRSAMANCSQVHSVDKSRLRQTIGTVTDKELADVDKALCFSLGIDQQNYRSAFKKWENYIREYHIEAIEEVECLKTAVTDKAVQTLQKQIDILRKERDGYRALAESRQEKLDYINKKETA
jgi:mRNA interferase MazF